MTRKLIFGAALGALVVVAAVAAVLYASPYWAVYQLKKAAQERDVDALLAHVDERALRLSSPGDGLPAQRGHDRRGR